MFGMGFSEILLIFVIALVVLGPQKLPKVVAQVGRWAGKARAMARQFREQLENEINLDELTKTGGKPAQKTPPPDEYTSPTWPPGAATPAADPGSPYGTPADASTGASTDPSAAATAVDPDTRHHDTSHVEAAPMSAEALAATPPVATDPVAEAPAAPSWTSDVHDNRLHPPAAPETVSSTPIIETHERGA
jgi:sec-independent protein translocase protein TatB